MINYIPIKSIEIDNIEMIKDQLLYCIDTKEAYFDLSNKKRIQIGCTIQLENMIQLNSIEKPLEDKLYILKDKNKSYRYIHSNLVEITTIDQISDLVIPADMLIPTTLNKRGINYAPKTLAKLVYTNDGNNIEDILRNISNKQNQSLIYTRTKHIMATIDGQRVFDIPFPIENYDLAKFPMLILYEGQILPVGCYSISDNQLILNKDLNGLRVGEILTFIFHYNYDVVENNVNATTIDNVRFLVRRETPENPIEGDVWFDTKNQVIKQFINGEWIEIVKNKEDKIYPFKILKSTISISSIADSVELTEDYQPNLDSMLVYCNSTYLEEGEDYTLSSDNKKLISRESWFGTEDEPVVLNIIIFKATNPKAGSNIIKKTIFIEDTRTDISLSNFDKSKDNIMIYSNSIYLEEGEDYNISSNGEKIISTEPWFGTKDEPVVLNIVIFKDTILEDPLVPKTEISKQQIFSALGITESQFNKLKKML